MKKKEEKVVKEVIEKICIFTCDYTYDSFLKGKKENEVIEDSLKINCIANFFNCEISEIFHIVLSNSFNRKFYFQVLVSGTKENLDKLTNAIG